LRPGSNIKTKRFEFTPETVVCNCAVTYNNNLTTALIISCILQIKPSSIGRWPKTYLVVKLCR